MASFTAKWQGRDQVMARLRRVIPDAEKELATAQAAAAQELAGAIRSRAPLLTGEYAASIEAAPLASRPGGRRQVGIAPTKDPNAQGIFALYIWRFIEFGSRAHVIVPKKARGLFFVGKGGKGVFVGSVRHPGTPARPHVFPTYRAMRKRIRRKIANAMNKVIRKAKGR